MSEKFYDTKWFWAILCATIVEGYAISQGIDGIALGAFIAALAGLGGFSLGKAEKTAE